jgi:hypothetical protein
LEKGVRKKQIGNVWYRVQEGRNMQETKKHRVNLIGGDENREYLSKTEMETEKSIRNWSRKTEFEDR